MKKYSGNTGRILQHLQQRGGITSVEAFELYGATRLSGIIYNLRQYGYDIISYDMKGKNRYGETVYFVEYRLKS